MKPEVNGQQEKILLLAASRDQAQYFEALAGRLEGASFLSTKQAWIPLVIKALQPPSEELKTQAELLTRRKKNTAKGLKRSNAYWRWMNRVNLWRARVIYAQAYKALKDRKETHLGVWNGKKFRQAVWIVAAKQLGMKIVYFERGPLPGYSMVDAFGVNADSGNPRDVAFYQNYQCHAGQRCLPSFSEDVDNTQSNTVFVPFQVVEDSNIYLHSPWIQNMRQLYALVEKLSAKYPEWRFVLKEHPACSEDYSDLHQKAQATQDRITFKNEESATSSIAQAQAVITINSTVGTEALIAQKPVLVLGEALYAIEGITHPVDSEQVLLQAFERYANDAPNPKDIENFICYLQTDYAVPGDAMQSPDDEHWQAMKEKVRLILAGQERKAIGLSDE